MIGKTISHYRILEELGRGGMGVVYKAEDTKLKRIVALKFLSSQAVSSAEEKTRFFHEAQAAAALDDSNICAVHEIEEWEGQLFIVMAYVEGQSLKEKIAAGPLKIEEAVDLAIQIARGLQAAHEKGIIHRDVKPANILLTSKGQVRITDFGLAKISGRTKVTTTGTTLGTVAYMSPEQVRGEEVDHRSDIWSLGMVLYEMVTGQLPFKGEYEQAVFYSILNEQPEPPTALRSGVPMELERIILKMLAKNPDERYQHLDEVVTDLNTLKRHPTQPATPGKPLRSPRRKLGKIGTISLLGTLLLVLILLAVKYFFTGQLRASAPRPIAVISFENQTGDPQYDYLKTAIPNLLISKLEQSRLLRVTTWERMRDLLVQMGRPKVETIDKNLGFELCRRDSVHFIVLGSFTKAGNVFATDVKVLDVQSKQLLKSASARGDGAASILKSQIDQLSEQIIQGIGISAREEKGKAQLPVTEITTSSLEAYRFFLQARRAFLNLKWKKAKQYCYRAIEQDSTFALAYLILYLANDDPHVEIEALKKAHKYVHKAGKKWQYLINGFYALGFERNREKSLRLFRKMTEEFPREKIAHLTLGWVLYAQGEINRAIPYLKRALALDPRYSAPLNLLGYVYLKKKNFEKARDYFQRYIDFYPDEPNPYDSMGDLYTIIGQLDEAQAYYQQALQKYPSFPSRRKIVYLLAVQEKYPSALKAIDQYFLNKKSVADQAKGHFYKGFYFYWLGQTKQSHVELSQVFRMAGSQKLKSTMRYARWLNIWNFYGQGRLKEARQEAKQWYNSFDQKQDVEKLFLNKFEYQFAQAMIDLKALKLDSAQIRQAVMRNYLLEITDVDDKKRAEFHCQLLNGELLYQQENFEKAIEIAGQITQLRDQMFETELQLQEIIQANIPPVHDLLARIYRKEGKLEEAIEEYERLMQKESHFLVHPLYHFRLAKLYEEKGWVGKAMEQYHKFLDQTPNADEFLQQRKDAQAKYARLKGTK